MPYKTDYHIHTTFSDGKAAPEDYIPNALAAGISEIGFSEHLSLFKEDQTWCMNPDNVENYIECIQNLKRNTNNILIRTGLEIDFIPGKEKEIGLFLDNFKLDYRIGSVHYLGEKTVDVGPEFYEGKNIDKRYTKHILNMSSVQSLQDFTIL